MAAGVAHEIRNPLGSIRLNASLLMRDLKDSPDLIDLVSPLMQATEALDRIVAGLLDYTADREPDFQTCDLRTVIELSVAYARPELERNQVEVVRALDEAPESIVADPELLRRVLLNLILNASQAVANQNSGRIEIWVQNPTPDSVCVGVIDNGEGMSEDQLEKIFHPFFTSRAGGTGLGLSICHRLIEAHRGHIEVSSQIDQGSTFRVLLPLSPNHSATQERTSA
jgi:signal transduction histidine kinase